MTEHNAPAGDDATHDGTDEHATEKAALSRDLTSTDPAAKRLASDDGKEEIFNFPCDFPIKVMGKTHPDFADTIMAVVEKLAPDFDRSRTETRPSSGGNYTGLTVNINAQSRAQLDAIYMALTGHPMVKIVL